MEGNHRLTAQVESHNNFYEEKLTLLSWLENFSFQTDHFRRTGCFRRRITSADGLLTHSQPNNSTKD